MYHAYLYTAMDHALAWFASFAVWCQVLLFRGLPDCPTSSACLLFLIQVSVRAC